MNKFNYRKIIENIGLLIVIIVYVYICAVSAEVAFFISFIAGFIALSFFTRTKDQKCEDVIKKINEDIGAEYFDDYLNKKIEKNKIINDILRNE